MSESVPGKLSAGRQKLLEVAQQSAAAHAKTEEATAHMLAIGAQIGTLITDLRNRQNWPESQAAMQAIRAAREAASDAYDILNGSLQGTTNSVALEVVMLLHPILLGREAVVDDLELEVNQPLSDESAAPILDSVEVINNYAAGLAEYIKQDAMGDAGLAFTAIDHLDRYIDQIWPGI